MKKFRCFTMAALLGVAASVNLATASNAGADELYENMDILGSLECELSRDIRTMAGENLRLHCEFKPQAGLPDIVKGYSGSIIAIDESHPAADGGALAWTVLALNTADSSASAEGLGISGAYAEACASLMDEYGLKESSLTGGVNRNIILEPRDVGTGASGENAAPAIIIFTLSR